jgi:plasmid stabilization system protein ParE
MKIIWSPLAVDRASEIAGYIALDNPKGNRWGQDCKVAKLC